MTRDTFDINDAGEQPGPVVFSGDQSQPVRPGAALMLFSAVVVVVTVALWEFTGWAAEVIMGWIS